MVHHNPNPSSEETLEELRKVVTALPRMPKTIVDDTRHEKVLSYVSAFVAQKDPVLMQTMLIQWSILDVFQVSSEFMLLTKSSLPRQRIHTHLLVLLALIRRAWLQIKTTVSAV